MDKIYKLKYKGKWIKPKHVLGTYCYELYDDDDGIEPMSLKKATAWKNMISEENDLNKEEIELIMI